MPKVPKLDWIVNVSATGASKVKKAREEFTKLDNSAKRTSESFRTMKKVSIAGNIALAGFGAGAFSLGRAVINASSKIEDLETKFKPLLGSAEAAKERLKELAVFAASTPFQIEGIANASRVLETLTGGAMSSGEGLRLVGDAAAQTGEDMSLLATHVGRAYSALRANRTAGESLARMQELGLLTGEARTEIEELQKVGRGKEAFEVLRGELEKTSGSMDELSKTFSGKVSTMQDNWEALLRSVAGTGFAKLAVDALTSSIRGLTDQLNGVSLKDKMDEAIGGQNSLIDLAAREGAILEEQELTQKRILSIKKQISDEESGRNRAFTLEKMNKRLREQNDLLAEIPNKLKAIDDAEKSVEADKRKKQAEQEKKLDEAEASRKRLEQIKAMGEAQKRAKEDAKRLAQQRAKDEADKQKAIDDERARTLEATVMFNEQKRAIEQNQFFMRSQDYSLETAQREEAMVNAHAMELENLKTWYTEKQELARNNAEELQSLDDLYRAKELVLETDQNHAMKSLNDEQIANERRLYDEKANLASAALTAARVASGDNKVLALADIAFSGYMAQVRAMQLLPNIPLAATASILAATTTASATAGVMGVKGFTNGGMVDGQNTLVRVNEGYRQEGILSNQGLNTVGGEAGLNALNSGNLDRMVSNVSNFNTSPTLNLSINGGMVNEEFVNDQLVPLLRKEMDFR